MSTCNLPGCIDQGPFPLQPFKVPINRLLAQSLHYSNEACGICCVQVTIAQAIGSAYTVWLCVFGVLGIIPFATVRACNNIPVAMANGRIMCA